MTPHPPAQSPARPDAWAPTPVPTVLRSGVHLLVAALLLLVALRSVVAPGTAGPWVVVAAAVVGAVYLVGARAAAVRRSSRAAGTWLALLVIAWTALLVLSQEAVYLAFPWFFLLVHLLPRAVGVTAVVIVTTVAVAGFAWHQSDFTVAMVIGPVLGAAVVVATVFGYQALHAESEQRRRLIIDLDRTRSELATAEHRAGVLDERERLAREIHDTLAQGLSSIQLLLRAANRSLDPEREIDTARASHLVEQARHEAQENLAEARRFVRALAPGDLEKSTLAAALRRLCATTSSRTGIDVSFHEVGPATTVATPVEVALLRIAQSALGNTAQHSRASRADVTLTVMDTAVTLDVVDDGSGFDARAVTSTTATAADGAADPGDTAGGFGLCSMASRAAQLGGAFTVESHPGRGTAVSVHFARTAHEGPT